MRPLQVRIGLPGRLDLMDLSRLNAMTVALRQRILDQRPPAASAAVASPPTTRSSPVTVLSFEPGPLYQVPWARIEGPSEKLHYHELRQDLRVRSRRTGLQAGPNSLAAQSQDQFITPKVVLSEENERINYNGPGQLMFASILDLKSAALARMKEADFVNMLPDATTRTLALLYGPKGLARATHRRGSGLWVHSPRFGGQRQIAQLGYGGFQDGILCYAVSINMDMPVSGAADVSPWARLQENGLCEIDVTSVAAELGDDGVELGRHPNVRIGQALKALGASLATRIGVDAPEIVGPETVFGEDWENLGQDSSSSSGWFVDMLSWAGLAVVDL